MNPGSNGGAAESPDISEAELQRLFSEVVERAPREARKILEPYPDEFAVKMLELLNPSLAQDVLGSFDRKRQQSILASASPETRQQWMRNQTYPENTVGRLMEPPLAVFRPEETVGEATEQVRHLAKRAFITYGFVTDEKDKLLGVVVMRELLLSDKSQRVDEIMLKNPFYLTPEMTLTEAMKAVLIRHYPVYPVCDGERRLIGLMRGQMLFEAQAVELSAQPGSMVGVEKEERLSTPWPRSFRYRHPWLQVNLILGFVAAAVIGYFQGTIDRLVALAVFMPVVIGQSSNTGVQTLAVALRGMTLGELAAGREGRLVFKETFLGFLNGMLTGVTAALGMYLFATMQKSPNALKLSIVIFISMTASCLISGIFGAVVPLILRRFGIDPANASSIVLTTITDVVSLAVFLGLATWLV